MFIFGPLHGIFLIISLALLVVEVVALVDACIRPAQLYPAAGKQTKVFWVVILILAIIFRGIGILGLAGLVAAIVYLVDVRPAIKELRGGSGPGGGGSWRELLPNPAAQGPPLGDLQAPAPKRWAASFGFPA